MEETIVRPPRTIMEVFKMLPETTLAEVIDNHLFMSPAPIGKHQRIISRLFNQLFNYVDENSLGEVFISPFDVFLDEDSNAVQPDIFFITANRLDIVDDEGGVHGVPDLIIEVLSPGNANHDRITKKSLYQKFGVKEYWIVDPHSKIATGFSLMEGKYNPLPELQASINSLLLKKSFSF